MMSFTVEEEELKAATAVGSNSGDSRRDVLLADLVVVFEDDIDVPFCSL